MKALSEKEYTLKEVQEELINGVKKLTIEELQEVISSYDGEEVKVAAVFIFSKTEMKCRYDEYIRSF